MRFLVTYSSDPVTPGAPRREPREVELHTLGDLLAFAKRMDERLIVFPDGPEIEVYDDYRE